MNKVNFRYPNRIVAVLIAALLLISSANVLYGADPDKWIDIRSCCEKLSGKNGCDRVISLGDDTIWVALRYEMDKLRDYRNHPLNRFEVYAYSSVDIAAFSLGFSMNPRIATIDTAYISPMFSDFSFTAAVYANDTPIYTGDTSSHVLFGAVDTLLNYIEAGDTFYIGTCEFSLKDDLPYGWMDYQYFWFDSAFIWPGGDFIFVDIHATELSPTIFNSDTLILKTHMDAGDINTNVIPEEFELKQNYPNPFNPKTTIEFSIKSQSFVQLDVYNLLGHKVRTLINNNLEPGRKSVEWNGLNDDGSKVASGVYLYQLRIGGFVGTRKMILLK